jgi:hypothetical protein
MRPHQTADTAGRFQAGSFRAPTNRAKALRTPEPALRPVLTRLAVPCWEPRPPRAGGEAARPAIGPRVMRHAVELGPWRLRLPGRPGGRAATGHAHGRERHGLGPGPGVLMRTYRCDGAELNQYRSVVVNLSMGAAGITPASSA